MKPRAVSNLRTRAYNPWSLFPLMVALLLPCLPSPSLCLEVHLMTLQALFDSADRGSALSQCELGKMYEEGNGVEQSYDEALEWYREAAYQGFPEAQYKLGTLYHRGKGVPRDMAEAVKWYRKAADRDYPEAQYNLGVLYYRGEDIPKDLEKAFLWFKKAAEHGTVKAQYQLAVMYANGEGVDADFDEAVSWLRKSAAQGYGKAERLLIKMGMQLRSRSAGSESAPDIDVNDPSGSAGLRNHNAAASR